MRYGPRLWSSEQWRHAAASWLDSQLAAAGIVRTGEVTQPHLQPWGTVLRAPTDTGPVWLKAPGPETAFEIELYRLLAKVVPDSVLVPIATDPERGWMLLPDGGPVLGDRLDEIDLVNGLVAFLPQYGQLQRNLMSHVDSLLMFGITDMRPAVMPRRFDEAVAAVDAYLSRHGDAADRETLDRVAARRDTFVSLCDQLAGATVAASIDHNDLHPWNMFVGETGPAGRVKFYDWGDGVVSHPFASMLVGLGFLRMHLDVAPDDPAVIRVRDAYLEAFTDLAPHADLVRELELACWIGKAARALTWDRSLRAQDQAEAGEFARAPFESLRGLLDESYLDTVA